MRKLFVLLTALLLMFLAQCCSSISSKDTYLTREVSCYRTPEGDGFGVAVKLNRTTKQYTLYENSFRNPQWRVTKSGSYSEKVEDDIVTCDFHIEPEHFGDVFKMEIYIESDDAVFISISSSLHGKFVESIK